MGLTISVLVDKFLAPMVSFRRKYTYCTTSIDSNSVNSKIVSNRFNHILEHSQRWLKINEGKEAN
jgi:hypothetical protein